MAPAFRTLSTTHASTALRLRSVFNPAEHTDFVASRALLVDEFCLTERALNIARNNCVHVSRPFGAFNGRE